MGKYFILTASAKAYFDKLNRNSQTGTIARDLEQWWLCAQVGLLAGKMGSPPEEGSPDMVDYFIKSLEPHQARIRAMLLMRHLQRVNAGGLKRRLLEQEMDRLLARSPSMLTPFAIDQLNRYATGGFELVRENVGEATELFVFLLEYRELLSSIVSARALR